MHPLSRQVQIACDTAKGAAGRLAGIEVPKHEDTETTLPELKARIAKTVDFLKTVTAVQMAGDETRAIEIKFPNGAWKFTALGYITDFVLPNFYFHASMIYALLRKGGVEVGKRDFLGAISSRLPDRAGCRTWQAVGPGSLKLAGRPAVQPSRTAPPRCARYARSAA